MLETCLSVLWHAWSMLDYVLSLFFVYDVCRTTAKCVLLVCCLHWTTRPSTTWKSCNKPSRMHWKASGQAGGTQDQVTEYCLCDDTHTRVGGLDLMIEFYNNESKALAKSRFHQCGISPFSCINLVSYFVAVIRYLYYYCLYYYLSFLPRMWYEIARDSG